MPELPEVETVRRGLSPHLVSLQIQRVLLHRGDLRFPFPPDLALRLEGCHVAAVERRAKYLLIQMREGVSLLVHLGMSGRLRLLPSAQHQHTKHMHVEMFLSDGWVLSYEDPRRFGVMDVLLTAETTTHPLLVHLGAEPLEDAFTPQYLSARLAKRSAPIKQAIMDQEVVVGVGNIYASEALFRARIHPQTPANEVTRWVELVNAIREVLRAAIDSGGSTLRDYVRSDGNAGYFQHHFEVYGRKGGPCTTCGTPIAHLTQAGRATYFCPQCQRPSS